ncbi:hypothetical protein ACFVIZ_34240 [Streptomyces anulatus]|uniref:hypothetical protein n=1 Tax=Streptomyces anulatus TaxID=1892 RepID=UPI003626ABE4
MDETLAAALRAQGEGGVRALGLLRDAHRILSGGDGLERPGEIVEARVRTVPRRTDPPTARPRRAGPWSSLPLQADRVLRGSGQFQ